MMVRGIIGQTPSAIPLTNIPLTSKFFGKLEDREPPSRHPFTLSPMPGAHGAVENRASSTPGWSTAFFFLCGIAVGQ